MRYPLGHARFPFPVALLGGERSSQLGCAADRRSFVADSPREKKHASAGSCHVPALRRALTSDAARKRTASTKLKRRYNRMLYKKESNSILYVLKVSLSTHNDCVPSAVVRCCLFPGSEPHQKHTRRQAPHLPNINKLNRYGNSSFHRKLRLQSANKTYSKATKKSSNDTVHSS